MLGQVLWFNEAKGYGWLRGADDEDVFFSYAAIQCPGLRTLPEGQPVEYEAAEDCAGLVALYVVACAPVVVLDERHTLDIDEDHLVERLAFRVADPDAFVA